MGSEQQLHQIVRQLRTELEWAARIGIVIEGPKADPRASAETSSSPPFVAEAPASEPPQPAPVRVEPPRVEPARVEPPRAPVPSSPPAAARLPVLSEQLAGCHSLEDVRAVLGDCTRCKLHRLGRKQIVFGVGNPKAEIMFVGEGPGAEEDKRGEPFVGAAGELLTTIIEKGMGMPRAQVYIANVVKCRPPQNRDPEHDEVESCEPFLKAQIQQIKPRVIVTLGKHAAHTLLKIQTPITRLRGTWSEYEGTPLLPTYHPAYLLRNPAEKRAVWEDVKEVLRFLDKPIPTRGDKT